MGLCPQWGLALQDTGPDHWGQCWGRKCPSSRLRIAVVLWHLLHFTPFAYPPNPDAWKHLQKSGKPSSDVNCNFILTYISEFVPCPAPPPPPASDQSRPPCDLYVALFGLDLWPSDAPDLEHWLRWSLQASTTPVYTMAHGSIWSHFYPWRWNLGPNYSGVNRIALSWVVGARVVCWLLWRVLRFYLVHNLTKFYCLSWTLRIKVNNKVHEAFFCRFLRCYSHMPPAFLTEGVDPISDASGVTAWLVFGLFLTWTYGREFGWTLGVGDGQGGLACCNSWGRKESDTTERRNWTECGLVWNIRIQQFNSLFVVLLTLYYQLLLCSWSQERLYVV